MLSTLRSRASGPAIRKLGFQQPLHSPSAQLLHRQQALYALGSRQQSTGEWQGYGRDRQGSSPARGRFGGGGQFGGGERFGRRDRFSQPNRSSRSDRFGRDAGRSPRFPRAMEGEDEILEGTADTTQNYITKFSDLKTDGQISPVLIDTITENMKFETMTPVQSKTINETLGGVDVIAQARTGTGKTIAFLLPILQSVLAKDPSLAQPSRRNGRRYREPDIRAVIISPTRELAEQIAAEANQLVANTSIAVQTAVGGTLKRAGLQNIMTRGCNLLVGTPGRLKDIFSDPFYEIDLSKVNGFVLDEADRLLDDGFLPSIKDIESYLPPKESRHNMLFSATVPREVLSLAQQMLNQNSRFVQTIEKGEAQTHEKIPQNLVELNGLENTLSALTELIVSQKDRSEDSMPFKALVFLNANAEVILYSDIFRRMSRDLGRILGKHLPVLEIHSRLSQDKRTLAAARFRAADQAIMFTSDVSARGMDYPNVSHVIQLGSPRTRDFYIHRVGRTGRGEKSGESWLFVSPMELYETTKLLRKIPVKVNETLKSASADLSGDISPEVKEVLDLSRGAAEAVDPFVKSEAYRGALGYMSFVSDKQELMDSLNRQATLAWGLPRAPGLSPSIASRLGVARYARFKDEEDIDEAEPVRPGGFSRNTRGKQGFQFRLPRDRARNDSDYQFTNKPRARAWV